MGTTYAFPLTLFLLSVKAHRCSFPARNTCQHGLGGSQPLAITPNRNGTYAALNQLLTAVAPKQAEQTAQITEDVSARLDRCIELTKAEASQAASLIADCAPHGKPMLAQAQGTLESLESLKMLEAVASEMFGS